MTFQILCLISDYSVLLCKYLWIYPNLYCNKNIIKDWLVSQVHIYLIYLKKERNNTSYLGFIGSLRPRLWFLKRSRLKNYRLTFPYRLTSSVWLIINAFCRSFIDSCQTYRKQRKYYKTCNSFLLKLYPFKKLQGV